jgi:hypothetical protein
MNTLIITTIITLDNTDNGAEDKFMHVFQQSLPNKLASFTISKEMVIH